MKRQAARKTAKERSAADAPIDYVTIAILEAWKRMDATNDPELIRAADEELEEFKRAMNENRAATGEPPVYP
jgi:hypothetical protein